MSFFIDEARIHAASGDGGHGCVSFRREKYIPFGGPDGGDGGRGGDIIFRVQRNVKTLAAIRRNGKYLAQNGQPGRGRGMHGSDGRDLVIIVPPGTRIKDADTGDVLVDFLDAGTEFKLLSGGKGGLGNKNFATSRNQAPRYAQPGLPGDSRNLVIELSLIADIGFVGFPNAGKSSLLRALTAANPKIGPYPFTTRVPNLGVLNVHDTDIVLADIPGIIEGASQGHGLGLRFLKHIARVAGVAFMVDMSDTEDKAHVYTTLINELASYGHGLENLPRVVLASKMDLPESQEALEQFAAAFPELTVIPVSSHSRMGLAEVEDAFFRLWQAHDKALAIREDLSGVRKISHFASEHADAPHPYEWDGADAMEEARRHDSPDE